MSAAQLVGGSICVSWRHAISSDMILTAWEHANDQLKTDTQEEFTCCGVDQDRQNMFNTPDGHPACNSTHVREHYRCLKSERNQWDQDIAPIKVPIAATN